MPKGEPFDSSNPEHVKAGKRRDQFQEDQRTADLRAVWSLPEGRRVLWAILTRAGVHRISYHPGSPTASTDAAFFEGSRNVGLSIEADALKACPEMYFLAHQEANQKEKDSE